MNYWPFGNPFAGNGNSPAVSSGRDVSPIRFVRYVGSLLSSEQQQQQAVDKIARPEPELPPQQPNQKIENRQRQEQERQEQQEEREILLREDAIKNAIKEEKQALSKKVKQAEQEERRLREKILAEEERVLQERKAERKAERERTRPLKKIENEAWTTERLAVQRTDDVVLNDIKTKVFEALGIESDTTSEGKITNRLPKDKSLVEVIDLALETYIHDSSLKVLTKMPDPLYSSSVSQLVNIIRLKALSFILNSTNDEPEDYNGYNELNLRSPIHRLDHPTILS
jgi:type IV secretory pathway VirB10-like protein